MCHFFAIFENGHYAAEQVYIYKSRPNKKRQIWPRTSGKVFILKNNRVKLAITFLLLKSPKENSKLKNVKFVDFLFILSF